VLRSNEPRRGRRRGRRASSLPTQRNTKRESSTPAAAAPRSLAPPRRRAALRRLHRTIAIFGGLAGQLCYSLDVGYTAGKASTSLILWSTAGPPAMPAAQLPGPHAARLGAAGRCGAGSSSAEP